MLEHDRRGIVDDLYGQTSHLVWTDSACDTSIAAEHTALARQLFAISRIKGELSACECSTTSRQ